VMIMALPAVLALRKIRSAALPTMNVGGFEESLTMPRPVILIGVKRGADVVNVKPGAPGLNCSVPIEVTVKGGNKIDVVFDAPKIAVPVGTTAGTQLEAVFQLLLPGEADHIASWACAPVPNTHSANDNAPAFRR
jgi:hypothetical protein